MLQLLFQQFSGFQVAYLGDTPGTGYVDFDAQSNAAAALRGLQGFRLNATHCLILSFDFRNEGSRFKANASD